MSEIKERREFTGIPIEAWLLLEKNSPQWLKYCRDAVDYYESMTGQKDTDSGFAQSLRY